MRSDAFKAAAEAKDFAAGADLSKVSDIPDRETGLQMALARWYAKHAPDPAGWHLGPATLAKDPGLGTLRVGGWPG